MNSVEYAIGNPITLLVERIFWLGIGVFLMAAIFISILQSIINRKNRRKTDPSYIQNLANKAVLENIKEQ